MTLFPMLKLMISATIESDIALTALKKRLFATNLASWRGIGCRCLLGHLAVQ